MKMFAVAHSVGMIEFSSLQICRVCSIRKKVRKSGKTKISFSKHGKIMQFEKKNLHIVWSFVHGTVYMYQA